MPLDPAHAPETAGWTVAVGGADDGLIDKHFGEAEAFLVYRIDPAGAHLLESRRIADHALPGEDRRSTILRMLLGCRTLLVAKVGAAPQALLASAGIEATAAFAGRPVREALAELAARPAGGPAAEVA